MLFSLLFWLSAVTIAITIHEAAHAYVSDRLGDPTARLLGRISLNPLKHYDPIGTTMLLVTSIMNALGAPTIPFGWAKPVPFDPYNLQNPRRDGGLIALAGPASNFILALVLSVALNLFAFEIPLLNAFLYALITVNVALGVFNLLPIHPLDGGKIIMLFLPNDLADEFESIMRSYGTVFLIFLIVPFGGSSLASAITLPATRFFLNLLLP